MKHDIFISYSRKDYVDNAGNIIEGNIISKIKDFLTANGYTYWIDEKGIYHGDEFVSVITEAIQNSEVFLFVSTAASNKSDWTNHEIAVAKLLKKKTIPFKVDNTIYNTSILMYLAPLDYIDYPKNNEKAFDSLLAALNHHWMKLKEQELKKIEEEQRRIKAKEEEEAKLKAEEAKNNRIAAINEEIEVLKINIEKKIAERESLQSSISTLKDKISEYLSDIETVEENIKSLNLSIKILKQEKDSLSGINLNKKNIVSTAQPSIIERIAKVFKRNTSAPKADGRNKLFTSLNAAGEWLQNLNSRYWMHLLLLLIFGCCFAFFAVLLFRYLLFHGGEIYDSLMDISYIIISGGIVWGIIQLLRKQKSGILILFFNGILAFFLGNFFIHCNKLDWGVGFCIYQFVVYLIYLIHKTDKTSEHSWKNMKGYWVKKPKTFFSVATILSWGISYLIPFLYASSCGINNYDADECDWLLSLRIEAALGDRWAMEWMGDFYINEYNRDLLKRDPYKAHEWYTRAGKDENSSKIEKCQKYIDIEEKGYYISPIHGKCGYNKETDEFIFIDIKNYDGGGLSTKNEYYKFTVSGKYSTGKIHVKGATYTEKKENNIFLLSHIVGDSVKISYEYLDSIVAERVIPVSKKKTITIDGIYDGDRIRLGRSYTIKIGNSHEDGEIKIETTNPDLFYIYKADYIDDYNSKKNKELRFRLDIRRKRELENNKKERSNSDELLIVKYIVNNNIVAKATFRIDDYRYIY